MNAFLQALTIGSEEWLPRLWHASWQGAIAIVLAGGIARWCTFLSPRVVSWIWRLVCAKLLISLLWLAPVSIPLLPARATPMIANQGLPKLPTPWDLPTDNAAPANAVVNRPSTAASKPSTGSMLLIAWSMGVVFCLANTARQWTRVRNWRRSAQSIAMGRIETMLRREVEWLSLRRVPRLLSSNRVDSPLLVGVAQPAIILPAGIEESFSEDELRLMLSHELAHLKRRDLAWNWLPTIVGWLFFFHPLVWFMNRRWVEAQESACDELVLQQRLAQPAEYGRLLLKLAARTSPLPGVSLATAGVLGGYRKLERRVLAMTRVRPFSWRRLTISAGLLALMATPGIIPWRLVAQEASVAEAPDAKIAKETSQSTNEAKLPQGTASFTVAAVGPAAAAQPPQEKKPPSEKHQRAAAQLEKAGARISDFAPQGFVALLSVEWKGSDSDLALLLDLDDLRLVVIGDCTKFSPQGIARLGKPSAPAMLQLMQPSDEQVSALKGAENIKNLSLFGNLLTDAGLAAVATLPNLKSLLLAGGSVIGEGPASKITDAGLAALAKCQHLWRLSVNDCPLVTGKTMDKLVGLGNLEDVWLIQLPLSDEGLAAVARLPDVKRLTISAKAITPAGYTPLRQMKILRQLSVSEAAQFDDSAAANLVGIPQLRILSVWESKLTDAGFAHLGALTSLQSLDIGPGNFSDAALAQIKNLRQLRQLSLNGDQKITDAGLANLGDLTNLQQLSLSSKTITDAGLKALAPCTALEVLDLSGSGIRGTGFGELQNLPKLRVLNLSDSPIKDSDLSALAKLPALQILNLSNTALTDEGLGALAKLPQLANLNLSGDKITDAGLDALVGLKPLRSLDIDSEQVTKEGVKRLEDKVPGLSVNWKDINWSVIRLTGSFVVGGEELDLLDFDDDSDSGSTKKDK